MDVKQFIPEAMRVLPNWGLWKLEPDRDGRTTKVPYNSATLKYAKSNDPSTWCKYESAYGVYRQNADRYNGLAFSVAGSGMIFIDIDHCVIDGNLTDQAAEIMETLGPVVFWELSQSGTGLHGFMFGEIEKSIKNSKFGVEMYSSGRFCAMTGRALFEREPGRNDDGLQAVYEKYRTRPREAKTPATAQPVSLWDDRYIIEKASTNEKSGTLFRQLMSGDYSGFSSPSDADYCFIKILYFWCDGDPETIKRIARSSLLMRDKWNRPDYLNRTIERARNETSETLSGFIQRRRREEADAYYKSLLQPG